MDSTRMGSTFSFLRSIRSLLDYFEISTQDLEHTEFQL